MVMSYANRPGDVARAHQALAEVNRLRLLEVLRAYPKGLSAAEASAEVRLHQATTRQHLEMLAEAGLVVRTAEERTVRGRPRVIYRPSGPAEPGGGGGYRLLADILASTVETSVRRPSGAAEAAGRCDMERKPRGTYIDCASAPTADRPRRDDPLELHRGQAGRRSGSSDRG